MQPATAIFGHLGHTVLLWGDRWRSSFSILLILIEYNKYNMHLE